jgi:5-methylcytosine-specific restriction endonuclease McrA
MTMLLEKTIKKIVYIQEFDKYDNNGKLLCRNISCNKYPQPPYKKYCSRKCNKEFRHWYYHNFFWERIRSDIFKRDNYTCQICERKFAYFYRRKFARSKNLECDHIIPRSLYEQLGYKYDTLENKIKTTLEFFHNHNNLRTLCQDCHKEVTSKYLRNKCQVKKKQILKKNEKEKMII